MPASGRGANLDTSRRIGAARAPTPAPTPLQHVVGPINLRSTSLPQQPIKAPAPARKTPPATPNIPRLPNPNPQQTHAALHIANEHQKASGKSPAAYWREVGPQYRATIQHYAQAAFAHQAALTGQQTNAGLSSAPVSVRSLLGAATDQEQALSVASRSAALRKKAAENPGGGLYVPGAGTIRLAPVLNVLRPLANIHVAPKGWLSNIVNEAIDLPGQTFLSSAIAGSATRSAIEGKPGELEALGKGVLHQVEHPVQSFKQAPLSTALTFAGGEAAIGGALGKVARAGALGDRAAELAATVRPDLNLYAGEKIQGRRYNPDPLRKAGQVAYEKALTKLPEGAGRQRSAFQAEGWRLKRAMVGGPIKPGQVEYIRPAGERTRRHIVKGATSKLVATKPGQGADAVPLIVQGVVRTPELLAQDLRREAGRLKRAQSGTRSSGGEALKGKDLAANKVSLERVQSLLRDKEFLADPSEAFRAAQRYHDLHGPLTGKRLAQGSLREDQMRASLFPYAQAHMGASHFTPEGKLLSGMSKTDGTPLSNAEILAHMKAHGVQTVSHLSHRSGIAGKGSFYKPTTKMPTLESFARTGSSFEKGTADHSWEAVEGSLANNASKVAQAEVRTRELNRTTVGRYETKKQAEVAADNLHHTREGQAITQGLGKFVPVQLGAKQILEKGHVQPGDIRAVLKQFGKEEHTPVPDAELGKWALQPEKVKRRFEAHDNAVSARGEGKQLAQRYTQGFRRAKLYTSTRHIVGVAQELGIRLATENTLPRALGGKAGRTGRMARQNFERLAEDDGPLGPHYRELNDALGSRGSLYTSTQDNDIIRKGNLWQKTSSGAVTAPAKAWRAYYKTLQKGMHKVEQGAYDALLGKALSEFFGGYRAVLKLQNDGMEALVRDEMTPQLADSIARRVDDMMGNWSHQTPEVRRAVQTWSPFGLWWLNSMRWLYRLPVTHPVKTAIAAALYNATREQRNAQGQGFDAAHPVPGFLTGTIHGNLPIVGKVNLNPTYYSPMGVAEEPWKTALEQTLPQARSIEAAAKGVNPLSDEKLLDAKGNELKTPALSLNVLSEVLTGPAPGATQLQQLLQKGGKPLGTANLPTDLLWRLGLGSPQITPHTERSLPETLVKMLSPARFTYDKRGASKGGSASHRRVVPPKAPSALQHLEASGASAAQSGPSPLQLLESKR